MGAHYGISSVLSASSKQVITYGYKIVLGPYLLFIGFDMYTCSLQMACLSQVSHQNSEHIHCMYRDPKMCMHLGFTVMMGEECTAVETGRGGAPTSTGSLPRKW